MTWTTYCMKHETLEAVDEVVKVIPFMVEQAGPLGPERNGRAACEVRAVTDKGCKAHFIGGSKWSR
jgi:hypothetical protein